jgi:hypothetical protein
MGNFVDSDEMDSDYSGSYGHSDDSDASSYDDGSEDTEGD